MGIFDKSPLEVEIEKATLATNTTENWALYMDVCDKVTSTPNSAKSSLKIILTRMSNLDPHVALQAVTLLDACVNNCGRTFHLEIASRDFEKEFSKILRSHKKCHSTIAMKMMQMLKGWVENDFKDDPQLALIPELYKKLREEGYENNINDNPPKSTSRALKNPSNQQEQDEIAKAIELSLREAAKSSPKKSQERGGGGGASASAYSALYPSFTGVGHASGFNINTAATGAASTAAEYISSAPLEPEPRKVRALYDFEAAEENELTFSAGEIIHVTDDSDPNWWKGYNQRSDGLFPSNFVTADLSVDPERMEINKQQKAMSDDLAAKELQEKTEAAAGAVNQSIEIDETKIDRLLHLLHEANPEDPSQDTEEMRRLEREVHQMGPLIDAELERVDRKHAHLTQLSVDLVEAINLYHSLMRDDQAAAHGQMGGMVSKFAGGMPSGVGMSLPMGYQSHMLYGGAGYPGATSVGSFSTDRPQLEHNFAAVPNFGGVAHMPPTSNSAAQVNSGQFPPASAVNVPAAGVYAPHQMPSHIIPMQFHNREANGASTVPSHMYGAGRGHQAPNYAMLPPQQQQRFQEQQQAQAAATVMNQQHQMPIPSIQQQQFMCQSQNHAFIHAQQHPQSQQHFLPMQSGPSAYNLTSPHPGHNNNNNTMQQQQSNQQPNTTNNVSQLQQQMAAMSVAPNNIAAANNPVSQNFLVQNKPANNIPIYQQQR